MLYKLLAHVVVRWITAESNHIRGEEQVKCGDYPEWRAVDVFWGEIGFVVNKGYQWCCGWRGWGVRPWWIFIEVEKELYCVSFPSADRMFQRSKDGNRNSLSVFLSFYEKPVSLDVFLVFCPAPLKVQEAKYFILINPKRKVLKWLSYKRKLMLPRVCVCVFTQTYRCEWWLSVYVALRRTGKLSRMHRQHPRPLTAAAHPARPCKDIGAR